MAADPVSGLVLLDKKPGLTSFQSLGAVKRLYGRTVGHTGTLDKFAEGLLVVLVGKLTKLNALFTSFDKVYEADFTFGRETSTLDPEGKVVFEGPQPDGSLLDLAPNWKGPQMQVPPEYSAIHVDGTRASDRVRRGEVVEMAPRPIVVYSLDVLAWSSPVLSVRIHCSKGTYVRSIARDWGRASGFGAHVTRLRRTSVGPFGLPGGDLEFRDPAWTLQTLGIPVLTVDGGNLDAVFHGRPPVDWVEGLDQAPERVGIADPQGHLVALVERRSGRWVYLFVDQGARP